MNVNPMTPGKWYCLTIEWKYSISQKVTGLNPKFAGSCSKTLNSHLFSYCKRSVQCLKGLFVCLLTLALVLLMLSVLLSVLLGCRKIFTMECYCRAQRKEHNGAIRHLYWCSLALLFVSEFKIVLLLFSYLLANVSSQVHLTGPV